MAGQDSSVVDTVPSVRDDLPKLPLSRAAKAYARRRGLASLRRQPHDWLKVQAELTNPPGSGRPTKGFQSTDSVGYVGLATEARRSAAEQLVEQLLAPRTYVRV